MSINFKQFNFAIEISFYVSRFTSNLWSFLAKSKHKLVDNKAITFTKRVVKAIPERYFLLTVESNNVMLKKEQHEIRRVALFL